MKILFSACDDSALKKSTEHEFSVEDGAALDDIVEQFNLFIRALGYVNDVDILEESEGGYYDRKLDRAREFNDFQFTFADSIDPFKDIQ